MHRFCGHFFDLTIITLGTSNFDLTPRNQLKITLKTLDKYFIKRAIF